MQNNILILGQGFIGQRLHEALNFSKSASRINTYKDAEQIYEEYQPKIIINCIGYSGTNNVDDCEKNVDRTLLTNTFIPLILAELALRKKIKLITFSSGCIYHYDYEKQNPLTEEDIPDFFDLFYSRSKIYAEMALEELTKRADILTIRIRVPLDNRPHSKNILTKLLSCKRIIDIPNSITYIPDFIDALKYLIETDARGVFNVVNKEGLRYPELMEVYKKYVPDFSYELLDYKELNTVRTNLILSIEKLEKTGFKMRAINDILHECVKAYISVKG